ncbi:Dol-P-Man:Man(5)GlcNAc(2)-PP-Dol alpha-1,3-mannosyltransferase [Halotydeus destructor]|nr:Dol-P-Man:Man(5)GlcNAc(2)-PP-Dol alpha-1,3-mannosyltransferase [Halotydeus destructor]
MAVIRRKPVVKKEKKYGADIFSRLKWTDLFCKDFYVKLLTDPRCLWHVGGALILFEMVLNLVVIRVVKYTEIDWSTYMQQVECFLNGTLDYEKIEGSTGPIVYPAGHLYIYTILYFLTNKGSSILVAQHIFTAVYILNLVLVFRIYSKINKIPPYMLIIICCFSYRIHSIFVLRLFNDPLAVTLFYMSLNLFLDGHWSLGSLVYSLSVSVKMNILLFSPALLLIFLEGGKVKSVVKNLTICALVQILVAAPFLTHPVSYISRSFNLGRVFMYKWTVNWRLVDETIFLSQEGVNMVFTLFTANFIGIAFARSLHYQFYVWYYHSLPAMLWFTNYTNITKLCLLGVIELCWNTYPSTRLSCAMLHIAHAALLYGLYNCHLVSLPWKEKPIMPKTKKER